MCTLKDLGEIEEERRWKEWAKGIRCIDCPQMHVQDMGGGANACFCADACCFIGQEEAEGSTVYGMGCEPWRVL